MKKIVFRLSAGVGMDTIEWDIYPDDVTDNALSDEAWQRALLWAECFGLYPEEYRSGEDIGDEDDDNDQYTNDIEGWWEIYDPEVHDMLVPGGVKVEWDE